VLDRQDGHVAGRLEPEDLSVEGQFGVASIDDRLGLAEPMASALTMSSAWDGGTT
jgi:hypothetical protein